MQDIMSDNTLKHCISTMQVHTAISEERGAFYSSQ